MGVAPVPRPFRKAMRMRFFQQSFVPVPDPVPTFSVSSCLIIAWHICNQLVNEVATDFQKMNLELLLKAS